LLSHLIMILELRLGLILRSHLLLLRSYRVHGHLSVLLLVVLRRSMDGINWSRLILVHGVTVLRSILSLNLAVGVISSVLWDLLRHLGMLKCVHRLSSRILTIVVWLVHCDHLWHLIGHHHSLTHISCVSLRL